jgi:hypothetical protein
MRAGRVGKRTADPGVRRLRATQLRQPLVEFRVLGKDVANRILELGVPSELLIQAGAKQLLDADALPCGKRLDFVGQLVRQVNFQRFHDGHERTFDLPERSSIQPVIAAEAVQYRALDRAYFR